MNRKRDKTHKYPLQFVSKHNFDTFVNRMTMRIRKNAIQQLEIRRKMVHNNIEITVNPETAATPELLKAALANNLGIKASDISGMRITRKSIDARSRSKGILMHMQIDVYTHGTQAEPIVYPFEYKDVTNAKPVVVVGCGPAGIFAALRLIELGYKPIVLERGKDVSERKKDIAQLERNKGLNPESNFCFGEGGAGTFSDGKLFSRLKKKCNVKNILLRFHEGGAADEILYESHPHIGTDKLPGVIKNMRERIIGYGGEVHFNTKVTELKISDSRIRGVRTADGKDIDAEAVILATGHSARDVYEMLDRQGVQLECKGFAMGVRIEHQQSLIDKIQYKTTDREFLPAASYSLAAQVNGRGVYSFCMCPGGFIVPASTNEKETVVNGMSPSRRNSPFSNSALVVEIRPEDLKGYEEHGALAGLRFQQRYERTSFENGGGFAIAPAQRVSDFVRNKYTNDLPKTSYIPGLVPSPLHFWLPEHISTRLKGGLKEFDKKMHGFLTNDAIVIGVESRTSSPVRIPRDQETLEHVQIKGLYPCGEGAGYAGGITSSAIDGERCAEKIAEWLKK